MSAAMQEALRLMRVAKARCPGMVTDESMLMPIGMVGSTAELEATIQSWDRIGRMEGIVSSFMPDAETKAEVKDYLTELTAKLARAHTLSRRGTLALMGLPAGIGMGNGALKAMTDAVARTGAAFKNVFVEARKGDTPFTFYAVRAILASSTLVALMHDDAPLQSAQLNLFAGLASAPDWQAERKLDMGDMHELHLESASATAALMGMQPSVHLPREELTDLSLTFFNVHGGGPVGQEYQRLAMTLLTALLSRAKRLCVLRLCFGVESTAAFHQTVELMVTAASMVPEPCIVYLSPALERHHESVLEAYKQAKRQCKVRRDVRYVSTPVRIVVESIVAERALVPV